MKKKKRFLKEIKKGTNSLFLGLFFLVFSFYILYCVSVEYKEKMVDLHPLKEVKVSDVYAKIDAQVMTDYFATNDYSGIEHKTYFIWDEENVYIVDLNEKSRDALEPIYAYSYSEDENISTPSPVVIKGMTKKIPTDLENIAIEALNSIIGREAVTHENFNQTLGVVYLDTFESPISTLLSYLFVSIPTLVFGICLLISSIVKKRKTKKCLKNLGSKWEEVQQEIVRNDTLYFKTYHLYVTRNYIVRTQNGLEVYPYKDILWIYQTNYKWFYTLKSIFVMTKDKKVHKVFVTNNQESFDEIYDAILKHIPNALEGYTSENKEKVQEM